MKKNVCICYKVLWNYAHCTVRKKCQKKGSKRKDSVEICDSFFICSFIENNIKNMYLPEKIILTPKKLQHKF